MHRTLIVCRYPVDMVLLTAFTVCMSFLVGMITAFFDFEAVLLAFLATAVAVAVLARISVVSVLLCDIAAYMPHRLLSLPDCMCTDPA